MEIKNTKLRYLGYLSEEHKTQENMGRTTLTTLQDTDSKARPRGCLKAELLYFNRIQGILRGSWECPGVVSGGLYGRLEGSPEGVSVSV